MRKLNPETFRRAANLILHSPMDERFACIAIETIRGNHHYANDKYLNEFEAWFKPKNTMLLSSWFGSNKFPENEMARTLALLFMEKIAEDEI